MERESDNLRAIFKRDDIIIPVLGITGAGKTTFISKLCSKATQGIGHGLVSATEKLTVYSYRPEQWSDRHVHLVDTPGFDDTHRSDIELLQDIAFWISASYLNGFYITGIIYLFPISYSRVTGSTRKNFKVLRTLCGSENMASVALVTSFWSNLRLLDTFKSREQELLNTAEFWGDMISEGARYFRFTNDAQCANDIVQELVQRGSRSGLKLARELVDEGMTLADTAVGQALAEEVNKMRCIQETRLVTVLEETAEAASAHDEKLTTELENEQARLMNELVLLERKEKDIRTNAFTVTTEHRRQLKSLLEMLKAEQRGQAHAEDVPPELVRLRTEVLQQSVQQDTQSQQRQAGSEAESVDLVNRLNKPAEMTSIPVMLTTPSALTGVGVNAAAIASSCVIM